MLQVEVVDETADIFSNVEVGIECSWIEPCLRPTSTIDNETHLSDENIIKARRKILKQLVDKFKQKMQKARNFRRKSFGRDITEARESTSTTSTGSLSISSSNESALSNQNGTTTDIPLIKWRLMQLGIDTGDIHFVEDRVSKEVVGLQQSKDPEEEELHISHVKTGIWQVTVPSVHEDDNESTFFIVTGVSMSDRVDTKKLRRALSKEHSFTRKPKLTMAPQHIAEELAGYISGTMAPILHTVPLKLYLEESLVEDILDMQQHRYNVGSGMFGKCLSIKASLFLDVAKMGNNGDGLTVCPIIQKKRKT
ncbi:predicted protein [Chaetoceros tenuissimus]|uniref:Uncharacterized protein n=1 Tax=Chaetoceros tenuissimus TaxID=426638 RepID=A0AAD3CJ03_9STRA|nr:predicted protein [Chaetoceros tenuissimus]